MNRFLLAELARIGGGQLKGADIEFTAVSTDTRTLEPGALFVALKGLNFDGHDFVQTAKEKGAVAALVGHEVNVDLPQVVAKDPLAALSAFARDWRSRFSFPVIGITGSNGKTTTKELVASILQPLGATLVTRGNLNNHIGVPLTLLALEPTHRFAVIEMGANHLHEIEHLASLSQPTIGLVTNAGAAHLEGFGSLDGVAQGKGELFRALPADGTAVINADDRYFDVWREMCGCERVLTFGLERPADFTARAVRNVADQGGFRIEFELITPTGSAPATLPLAGMHNLRNALGAAAATFAAGATVAQIAQGLARMKPVSGRLELKPALRGAYLIDDSYNANPTSMKAGIDALRDFSGERWLVLGEMRELGVTSDELHAEVGRYARSAGITRLFAIGAGAKHATDAFGAGAHWFDSIDSLIATVRQELRENVAVLIKGSRSNRLERVAAALAADPSAVSGSSH
jgi:UDP-N-acetylmuramoyl-tripeptide--D-alanyl-D-alanine ligase